MVNAAGRVTCEQINGVQAATVAVEAALVLGVKRCHLSEVARHHSVLGNSAVQCAARAPEEENQRVARPAADGRHTVEQGGVMDGGTALRSIDGSDGAVEYNEQAAPVDSRVVAECDVDRQNRRVWDHGQPTDVL